jgi:zinc protease
VRALAAALAIASAMPAVAAAQQTTDRPKSKPVPAQTKPQPKAGQAPGAIAKAPSGSDSLRFDPLVRRGTLPNGMRYYVRRNVRPEKRAELRLAVNAGALLESDDQRGLAHFAEHMAFNGTKRFEKAEIVNFLERIGMSFGADLNAYTAFDETVYMLMVPTDSATAFRKSFQILADWANGVTFDTVEVNKERGVVIEEWRSRRGAQARVQDKQLPVLLQGSRYADRLPIGTPEGLQSFKQESLRRFYQDWYRPDMMAVVAVGDFNPDSVVSLIRREFASIKPVAKPTQRPTYPVPGNDTTLFSVATDKELTSSSVQIVWKLPKRTEGTAAEYRYQLIEELADRMLNQRFGEIAQRADAPFLAAGAGSAGFVRGADIYLLGANVKEGGIIKGMEGILTEAERAARFGFTAGELAREKADMLRDYERAYAGREKTNSAAYAGEYVNAFLERKSVV